MSITFTKATINTLDVTNLTSSSTGFLYAESGVFSTTSYTAVTSVTNFTVSNTLTLSAFTNVGGLLGVSSDGVIVESGSTAVINAIIQQTPGVTSVTGFLAVDGSGDLGLTSTIPGSYLEFSGSSGLSLVGFTTSGTANTDGSYNGEIVTLPYTFTSNTDAVLRFNGTSFVETPVTSLYQGSIVDAASLTVENTGSTTEYSLVVVPTGESAATLMTVSDFFASSSILIDTKDVAFGVTGNTYSAGDNFIGIYTANTAGTGLSLSFEKAQDFVQAAISAGDVTISEININTVQATIPVTASTTGYNALYYNPTTKAFATLSA